MGQAVSRPHIRILLGEASSLGPGKVALLEAIDRQGSISGAARDLGMSYRRAWLLVDAMNRAFREPLVGTSAGGQRGGGAALTPTGRDVLQRYRQIETKAARAVETELVALGRLLVSDH